ncbi:hypothetical protein LEMLEM_LOCUS934 [Lemmus lemmus]
MIISQCRPSDVIPRGLRDPSGHGETWIDMDILQRNIYLDSGQNEHLQEVAEDGGDVSELALAVEGALYPGRKHRTLSLATQNQHPESQTDSRFLDQFPALSRDGPTSLQPDSSLGGRIAPSSVAWPPCGPAVTPAGDSRFPPLPSRAGSRARWGWGGGADTEEAGGGTQWECLRETRGLRRLPGPGSEPGSATTNRKSGCNKEQRAGSRRAPGRPAVATGGGLTLTGRRAHLTLPLPDQTGPGTPWDARGSGRGSPGERPLGPPRSIRSLGRDSHSSLSESLPSPSRNTAGHTGRRAGPTDGVDPRRDNTDRERKELTEGFLCRAPGRSATLYLLVESCGLD